MNLKSILPTGTEVAREALVVLAGVLVAAFVLSRFPKLKTFVTGQSVTVHE